jgi:hypothetical protein
VTRSGVPGLVGIGSAALAVAAAVSYRSDPAGRRAAAAPIYLAAVRELGTTVKAAPIMTGVAATNNPAALQHVFDQFTLGASLVRALLACDHLTWPILVFVLHECWLHLGW